MKRLMYNIKYLTPLLIIFIKFKNTPDIPSQILVRSLALCILDAGMCTVVPAAELAAADL